MVKWGHHLISFVNRLQVNMQINTQDGTRMALIMFTYDDNTHTHTHTHTHTYTQTHTQTNKVDYNGS